MVETDRGSVGGRLFPIDGDVSTPAGEPVAVLVELAAGEDARFLRRWLANVEGYRVAADADDADVCVVDVRSLRTRGSDIVDRKRARRPAYLPVLLLVDRNVGTGDPLATLPGDVADAVDEHIEAPIRQTELARRLDALAQIHRLSSRVATSRERFRSLVASLPEAVVVVRDGGVVYANEAASTLLAVGDETNLNGRRLSDLVNVTEGADGIDSAVEATVDTEEFVELTVERADGTTRIVEMNATSVDVDEEAGRQVLFRNVTHHRTRQERLRLYRRAMDDATVGITIADASLPDNPLVYVNDEFCRLTGRSRAEVLGENARITQCPETSEETRRELREAIDAGESVAVEIRNQRADGQRWWNGLEVTPVRDGDGEVTHFVGFQRDVTDRRERQRRLEGYETMVRTTGNPMFVTEDGTFREVNDAFAELVGEPRDALVGTEPDAVLDEEAMAVYYRSVERLRTAGRTATSTESVSITNAEGAVRRFEMNVALLPQANGSVGILHDVTEREERQQRLAMLDRVLRHNLRNKLNVVLGYAEELRTENGNPELAQMETAARELLEMSETARDFHQTFSRDADPHRTDVVSGLDAVVSEMRERYPDATVRASFPDSAEAFVVEGTFLAIEEFVDNAVVHADADTPRVEVTVEPDGEYVSVRIRDRAPPLPAHERGVIDGDVERPLSHSSGVALWLSVWTIRRTGGEVRYERLEDGNRVTALLPAY
jgi:PAS domain S-box-containing protein